MVIRTTTWSPDTCGCTLDYTWDDTIPLDQITVQFSNVVNKCPIHSALSNNDTWNTVMDENPKKSISRQLLLDNAPSSIYDIVDVNGTREFKNGISLEWSFSGTAPNRVLNLTIIGITLTNQQRNTIRNVLNNRFGVGKVILN